MRALEAGAAVAAFIENTDEIDDGIAAAELAREHRWVVDVSLDQLHTGQDEQVAVPLASASGDAQVVAGGREPRGQAAADETGATEDANAVPRHATSRLQH